MKNMELCLYILHLGTSEGGDIGKMCLSFQWKILSTVTKHSSEQLIVNFIEIPWLSLEDDGFTVMQPSASKCQIIEKKMKFELKNLQIDRHKAHKIRQTKWYFSRSRWNEKK